MSCPLFEVGARDIYQYRYNHLEYFPIVNTRVFTFGKQRSGGDAESAAAEGHETKDINNIQLKETYRQFLLLNAYQDFSKGENADI